MRTKEAIKNRLLSYINQIWGTRNIEHLDALVQLLLEELVHELYLLQNRLYDIEYSIQGNLGRVLTDETCFAVSPAHTILHIKPVLPIVNLDRTTYFTLSEAGDGGANKDSDSIVFHPVVSTVLFNLKIKYMLHQSQLYVIHSPTEKELLFDTRGQASYNCVWLGVEADAEIEDLRGLSFFIDFPGLSEVDELYGVLPDTRCFVEGKELSLGNGIGNASLHNLPALEEHILHLYNDHYLYINDNVCIGDIPKRKFPRELDGIIDRDKVEKLEPIYWIKLQFSPAFTPLHLKDMVVVVNSFPALNKKLEKTTLIKDNFLRMVPLKADDGEKFIGVEFAVDNKERDLVEIAFADTYGDGNYLIKTVNRIFSDDFDLRAFIRLMLDKIEDERTAFNSFDKDKIVSLLSRLSERRVKRQNMNSDDKRKEVAGILIRPFDNTTSVNLTYWLTYGDLLNGISAGKIFFADKNSNLDGCWATSICDIHGGKELTDIQDLIAIDRFIFNSDGQIITEYDIVSFCYSILGDSVEEVDLKLTKRISFKANEGVVRVLEIWLTLSSKMKGTFSKGVLKDLLVRLRRRSPADYNYRIKVLER